MSAHRVETPTPRRSRERRGRRPGRLRSGRGRALMSLAAVAVLATGLSVKGTFAFWTDAATVTTGSFTAGTLDITLNGQLAGAANNGGSTSFSSFTLANMVPGESQSVSFPVANAGSIGFNYTVTGTATGALAPAMQFSIYAGTANAQTGTAANGNRTGTCSGTALVTSQVLSSTSTTLIGTAAARNLAASASENICVIAKLDPNADTSLQGKTVSAALTFNATQVGAS